MNGGQLLVEKALEGVMISPNEERSCPQVWPLVPHDLNELDQLALVRHQLDML
jgi:hypothetical protein